MSRLKNFSRNLAANYAQQAVNAAYALLSVPLILHWLPKAQFGLWALLVQLMSYLALIDLGMNGATSRLLVDHKDRRGEGDYGSLVMTSAVVSLVQGLIVLAVVAVASPFLATLMKIPPGYQSTFVALMRLQGVITAVMFCANPLAIILFAHQRTDLVATQGMATLIVSLGLLALFLALGCGIYSFIYANAITAVISPAFLFWKCRQLGFLPGPTEAKRFSSAQFREVFLYGKDIFLVSLGAQLLTASQTIIISRTLGLESAAAWTVGTRILMLVRQLLFQPYGAAAPGLSEMIVREEKDQLHLRFRNLVGLSASLGVLLGVGYAMCNSLFVHFWTHGKIGWSTENDVLLGSWLVLTSIQMPHCNFVTITKKIGGMRYLYFVEGCVFIALSLIFGYRWGLPGIIVCSIASMVPFSVAFGLQQSTRYFRVQFIDLTIGWLRPSLHLAISLVPLACLLWLATLGLPPLGRLSIHFLAIGVFGGFLFLRLGLPLEVVREAQDRLPRQLALLLQLAHPALKGASIPSHR